MVPLPSEGPSSTAEDDSRPKAIAQTLTLRRDFSVEDYVADPLGRYVCGATFVAYWASTHMNGVTLWGRPDEDDMKTVTRALDAVLLPGRPHHRVLIDASRLSSVDLRAFAIMAAYMVKHRSTHARVCTQQALIRPNGLPGAVVAGFYALIDPGYPVKIFDDAGAAIAWLEIPENVGLLQELDRIRSNLVDDSGLFLSEVRALLDKELGRTALPAAASSLAVSQRTLQRRLLDAGSSFRAEVAAAQLRLAEDLLTDGDRDIKNIASRVGYTSPSRFSAFFRRLTGQSPAAWRTRVTASRKRAD